MKLVRITGQWLSVFFVLILLSGCVWFTYHYEFSQEVDSIVSIDICRYKYNEDSPEMTIICSLDHDQIELFVSDIAALDSYKYFGDFSHTFDGILVYIAYENGEGEVLSAYTTATVDLNGNWSVRVDNFNKGAFSSVILKYVDPALVLELENP